MAETAGDAPATSRTKPTIQVPPRGSAGFLYANGSGPGFSPGPMTLLSSFFPEQSPFSFSQLLAGAMASPLAAKPGLSPAYVCKKKGIFFDDGKNSEGGVGRKWDRPVNLVVPPPSPPSQLQVESVNMSPLFMVPPGLSPSGLLSPQQLPSRRPAIACENCLYSLEQDSRVRAFHILDPKGVLEMLLVFLEERGSGVISHPSFDNSKDSARITPHLGTWKGHSVTKRSGVYGATIAEADTISILEINKEGQLVQDIRSASNGSNATTSVNWTGSISSNLINFDGGFQLVLLPGGMYMGCPSDVAKSVQESKSFHLELCWLESPGKRQRLVRTYDVEGLAVSSTYFLETRQ